MVFLHLFIVNKSGGLILQRPLTTTLSSSRHNNSNSSGSNKKDEKVVPKIGTNEWLRIGSTFHSLHAIAAEASPIRLENNKNECTCHDNTTCKRIHTMMTDVVVGSPCTVFIYSFIPCLHHRPLSFFDLQMARMMVLKKLLREEWYCDAFKLEPELNLLSREFVSCDKAMTAQMIVHPGSDQLSIRSFQS